MTQEAGAAARLLDGAALHDWAHTAVGDLIAHTDEINRLNVFPVADADTGTNMLFTMRAALAEADSQGDAQAGAESGPRSAACIAAALATGALHGARGNSGVILSQILRGLADAAAGTAGNAGDPAGIDAVVLGTGLRHGVELVVASMGGREVAGTIISVLAAAATAVEQCAADGLPRAVTAAADAAAVALDKTPAQLEVLADAGVVDAGGRGLLVLLDALRMTITGQPVHRVVYQPSPPPKSTDVVTAQPVPRFEVMYLLGDCEAAGVEGLRERLSQLGESVAIATSGVVGGYSVHVHTDDAGAAVEAGLEFGRPRRIQISALLGATGLPPGSWSRERAVLAVIDGDGAAELFAGEGSCVLRPDPHSADLSMISAQQLLRAVVDTGAAQVMLLPNGYVAAEELVAGCTAANGWGIDVVPVPTGSMVQGLAALAVHEPGRSAVDDGYTMARAAGTTRHGSVRIATEAALTWAGACRPGDGLGIAGDEVLIVARDVGAAASGLIDLLLAAGGELVTVLFGAAADDAAGGALADILARHVHDRHPGIELVTYRTGHRGDALLIGVE